MPQPHALTLAVAKVLRRNPPYSPVNLSVQPSHPSPEAGSCTTRSSNHAMRAAPPPPQSHQPGYDGFVKRGDDDGDAALSKKANSILNKLTLEKFDRLSTEFCALEFSTMERVAGAVDLIVTTAQTEI